MAAISCKKNFHNKIYKYFLQKKFQTKLAGNMNFFSSEKTPPRRTHQPAPASENEPERSLPALQQSSRLHHYAPIMNVPLLHHRHQLQSKRSTYNIAGEDDHRAARHWPPPDIHLQPQSMMEAANPNSGERALCHVSVCYCTVKLVKVGQTVNSSQIFKSGQRLVKQEGFNFKY